MKTLNINKKFKNLDKAQKELASEISVLINRFIAYGGHVELVTKNGEYTNCDTALEAYEDNGNIYVYSEDLG